MAWKRIRAAVVVLSLLVVGFPATALAQDAGGAGTTTIEDVPVGPSDVDWEPGMSATTSSFAAFAAATIPGFYSVGAFEGYNFPIGLALDPTTGNLWIGDPSTTTILDHGDQVIGTAATGAGGVAISGPLAYITDRSEEEVDVYDLDGVYQTSFGSGQLSSPCGIEVLGNFVYVADASNHELHKFAKNGSYLGSTDGADSGTVFDLSCSGSGLTSYDGALYAVDRVNNRVIGILPDLTWNGTTLTVDLPTNIDADATGQLWITTYVDATDASSVEVWSVNGVKLHTFDLSGSGLGQLDIPVGIVVDPTGDTFWVGEAGSVRRVQIFTKLLCDGDLVSQVGTSFGDRFGGTPGVDIVALSQGNDIYRGFGDDDIVCAGAGDDTIKGGAGNDTLIGQGGDDEILGGGGADEIYGSSGDDALDGQGGADEIYGSSGEDTIDGRGAADYIIGGTDNDIINGQNGADELHGADGDDTISGQTGPDTIYGEPGNDDMFGGNGNDTFYGGSGTDKCAGNLGNGDQAAAATCEQTPGIEILF